MHQLKETFTKACKDYLEKHPSSKSDCENVWTSFVDAFVGKDPCDVPPHNYHSLMNTAPPNPKSDKFLFWSKTQANVDALAKKRPDCFMTSRDTLLGFVMNELNIWCCRKGSKEIFNKGCPKWSDCLNNPVRSFWSRFSEELAKSASGSVYIVLSGSEQNPFNPESILASVEMKGFNPSKISSLTTVVVQNTNKKSCDTPNLTYLENHLDPQLKAKYKCIDVKMSAINNCINTMKKCDECFSQRAA